MSDDETLLPDGLDEKMRGRLREYLANWGRDLRERGLISGEPPRLRPDFLAALLRVLRGEVDPPAAASPPAIEVGDDAVEG